MKEILDCINEYERCVETGDVTAFRELWAEGDTSLLVSSLDAKGRDAITALFLEDSMIRKYENRQLEIYDVRLEVHGETAVAVFQWKFDAHNKLEGIPYHSEGIESQVYCKQGAGWKLVHEHYHTYPITQMEGS